MDVFEAVRAAREVNGVPGAAVGVLEEGAERHDAHGRTSLENPRSRSRPRSAAADACRRAVGVNNAGFALAGRVVEVVTGKTFEAAVQQLVFDPLELESTTFWPWDVMTERFAVGHVGLGEELQVARPWPVGRSAHAAGGIVSTTPDPLRYARLHLEPPPALAPMQEPQAATAEEGEWVGLTWYGEDRFGTLRHGGGTNGQLSM